VFFVAEKMLIKVTITLMVGVVLGRPDKDPIHMQHRVEVDQVVEQVSKIYDMTVAQQKERQLKAEGLSNDMATSGSDGYLRLERDAQAQERQGGALMPYRYGYAVQDDEGNDFNQQEQSDGNTITGQYSVLLPDGRVQTVTYSVSPNTGFVAEVTYT